MLKFGQKNQYLQQARLHNLGYNFVLCTVFSFVWNNLYQKVEENKSVILYLSDFHGYSYNHYSSKTVLLNC